VLTHALKGRTYRVVVAEGRGAPVTAIDHGPTGCSVLAPPAGEVRLDGAISPFVVGGFRDCFPSVTPYRFGRALGGKRVPPFGDLWGRFWSFPEREEEIVSVTRGKGLPYVFERRITAGDDAVRFEYEVRNGGRVEMPWLWSGQLTLPLPEQGRVIVPGDARVVLEDESARRAGGGAWPVSVMGDGAGRDLSRPSADGSSVRYLVQTGQDWIGVELPRARVRVRWHEAGASFGVWLNGGGWPRGVGEALRFMTLEPSTAPGQDLAEAIESGQAGRLAPGETARFSFSVRVERG
jgi:hypothetical protein